MKGSLLKHPVSPAAFLWLAYSLFILYSVLIPFDVDFKYVSGNIGHIRWIPFWNPDEAAHESLLDILQNIFFFIPFGYLALKASGRMQAALISALAMTCTIEALQLLTPNRITSITDIISNLSGAAVGAITASVLERSPLFTTIRKKEWFLLLRGPFLFASALAAAAWSPFYIRFIQSNFTDKLDFWVEHFLEPGRFPGELPGLFMGFCTLGIISQLTFRRLSSGPKKILLMASLTFLPIPIMAGQLMVSIRQYHLVELSCCITGFFSGIFLSRYIGSRKDHWGIPGMLFLLAVLAGLFNIISPPGLQPHPTRLILYPLWHYYWSHPIAAAGFMLREYLVYFPASVLAGIFFPSALPRILIPVFSILLLAEGVQLWNIQWEADITDWALQCLGFYTGFRLYSNFGKPFPPSGREHIRTFS